MQNRQDSDNGCGPRGQYKRWMTQDGFADLPKTTKWRRKHIICDEQDVCASQQGFMGGVEQLERQSDTFLAQERPEQSIPANITLNHTAHIDEPELEEHNNDLPGIFDFDFEEENEINQAHGNDDGDDDDSGLDSPLYENASISVRQCLLLLMSFILGSGLTSSAVTHLLKILSLILPVGNLLPDTKFLFDKYFKNFKQGMEFHLYCPHCHSWLGSDTSVKCKVCGIDFTQPHLLQKGCFFIYIPIKRQLIELLQQPEINSKLDHRFTRVKKFSDNYEDIYDGEMYKQIGNGRMMEDLNALSISFNCDGVPVFKSSNFSIWPLQGILNELPQNKRKDNILLLGLWFGSIKPIMTTFLKPFTDEMKTLGSAGIDWQKAGEWVRSSVFACVCSADSVARCILQNIKQFNGEYGCSWCYNPGETVQKGRGHCRAYSIVDNVHALRTHRDMLKNAKLAFQTGEPVKGVKGPTQLVELPHFDLVDSFVVDNLHCIDLGVARNLGHLWFDSMNHQQAWYIGNKIDLVDKRLDAIQPPSEITRQPRSIRQRSYWKGSEWHWWLLLYCPVVLSTILPALFYKHLLLLVEAVFLLSGSTISLRDLDKADACLFQFVVQFQQLYGINNMNYNVHQLLHLTKTVTDWGPLSCYSSYTFEGFNMVLLKLFHGTQAVPKQIANTFLLYKGVLSLASSLKAQDNDDDPVSTYIDVMLSGYAPLKKALKVQNDVTFLGAHYVRDLTIEEQFLVDEHFNEETEKEALIFNKAVVKGNILHSLSYRKSRRNNFTVGLSDATVAEIVNFSVLNFVSGRRESVAFVKNLQVRSQSCKHIRTVELYETNLRLIELLQVEHKYVVFQNSPYLPGKICCQLPNLIDRD